MAATKANIPLLYNYKPLLLQLLKKKVLLHTCLLIGQSIPTFYHSQGRDIKYITFYIF